MSVVISFIGYGLIALASGVLADVGLTIDSWRFWVIMLGYILGVNLTHIARLF